MSDDNPARLRIDAFHAADSDLIEGKPTELSPVNRENESDENL